MDICPHFSDRANVLLPHICIFFQPLMFVLVVPDITAKITHTCAQLKPMTQANQFAGFDIVWMHDHNSFLKVWCNALILGHVIPTNEIMPRILQTYLMLNSFLSTRSE